MVFLKRGAGAAFYGVNCDTCIVNNQYYHPAGVRFNKNPGRIAGNGSLMGGEWQGNALR